MKNSVRNDTRSDYLASLVNNKITFKRNYTKFKHGRQIYDLLQLPIDYYSTKLAKFHPRKREAIALCPFHKEKNPSFSVNLHTGQYFCFGCGVGGGMVSFHMKYYNQSKQESINALCRGGKCNY